MNLARLASITYIIWGLLHIIAAHKLYLSGKDLDPGMIQGRIFQGAWNLLFLALVGIAVAIFLNWKNSKLGYWLNLVVISTSDIGFVVTILIPGYLPFIPGIIGPALWVLGAALSTFALLKRDQIYKPKSESGNL